MITTTTTANTTAAKQTKTIEQRFNAKAYRLLDKIGEGGFGCVYRAVHNNTGQTVAIKFLTVCGSFDQQKQQRYHQRFERETLLCARLRHPNIVLLLDKGICDGLPYAVFEFVEGQTLKQHILHSGALPGVEAAQIMAQVLDALAHAHSQGILHRDIKPANIMLTVTGVKAHVKVLDFGIGTIVDEARQVALKTITITDEVLGTPAYSAPEQLRGEPCTLKTDLYVWGLVFLECLTGQRAISGSSVASVLHQQLSHNMIPLPGGILAHPVSAILRRVLEKKAYRRNAQAEPLYSELGKINFANLIVHTPAKSLNVELNTGQQDLATQTHLSVTSYTHLVERKQITALSLCLSIQSSAETPAEADVEVIDMIFRDLQYQCIDTAARFGGFHAGTLGDSMLFYFGYPVVNDSDVRLCARTALDIISKLTKRNGLMRISQGVKFSAQIGVHCGLVTCYGDEPPAGDMSNVAMLLARKAQPNQILCSEHSQALLNNVMDFHPCDMIVSGFDGEDIAIYAIEAEKRIEARSFFTSVYRDEGFVGRSDELKRLLWVVDNQTSHDFTSLYVCGEAGVGKSRLVYELRVRANHFTQVVAQCLPEQQSNVLYPILSLLNDHCELRALTPQGVIERLQAVIITEHILWPQTLTELGVRTQALTILLMWLNVPFEQSSDLSQLTPQKQKRLLFDIITVLLAYGQDEKGTEQVLFIVEDLHWADSVTTEFVAHFSGQLKNSKHRLLLSSRELKSPFENHRSVDNLLLVRLDKTASAQLIKALFDDQPVATIVIDLLVVHSDGVPLFIEALVDVLKQKKLVNERDGLVDFICTDTPQQLPATLRDSMQQQLDGLTLGKETAQLASVIGREFGYDILTKASDSGEGQVQADLQALIAANIIFMQRKVDGDCYIFKHALVSEAAYQSIPVAKRQQLHLNLANITQRDFKQRAVQQPHILAHHFAMAQMHQQAAQWFIRAGDMAKQLHSHLEYVNYYRRTVKQWSLLEQTESLCQHQCAELTTVYVGIGEGEIALGRHEQGRCALQSLLSLNCADKLACAQAHFQIGRSWAVCLDHKAALLAYQATEDCLVGLSPCDVSKWLLLKINAARMNVYYTLNDIESMSQLLQQYADQPASSDDRLQRAYQLQNEFQLRLRKQRYVIDEKSVLLAKTVLSMLSEQQDIQIRLTADFNYSMALYFSGDYQQAYSHLQGVLQSAKKLDDVSIMTLCYTYLAINSRHLQQIELTENYAQQAQTYAVNAGMKSYEAAAKSNLAWVALRRGESASAKSLLLAAMAIWQQTGQSSYPLQWLGGLLQLELLTQTPCEPCEETHQQLVKLAQLLLSEGQQKLPSDINDALSQMLKAQQCPTTMMRHSQIALDRAKHHNVI